MERPQGLLKALGASGTPVTAFARSTVDNMSNIDFAFVFSDEFRGPKLGSLLEAVWRLPERSWSGLEASWQPFGALRRRLGLQGQVLEACRASHD